MRQSKMVLPATALVSAIIAAWLLAALLGTSGRALEPVSTAADADTLFSELSNSKFSALLRTGDFEWTKRPFNWDWEPRGNAAIVAYRCTGDPRFLDWLASTYDQFLKYRDSELGRVDELRGKVLNSWSSVLTVRPHLAIKKHPTLGKKKKYRTNEVTTAALMVLPALQFVELVRGNEELSKRYGEQADRFLETAISALSEFDDDYQVTSDGRGYYVMPNDGRVEPLNHSHTAGAAFAILYKLTGRDEYKQKVLELARAFRASIQRESNGSYSWGYRPEVGIEDPTRNWGYRPLNKPKDEPVSEPFWKAKVTLIFPLAAHSHGIAFDDNDMAAFAKTFTENVYRGDSKINLFISSSDDLPLTTSNIKPKHQFRAEMLLGWIFLERFDPQVRDILEKVVNERSDFFKSGWFGSAVGIQAYAYRLCDAGQVNGY